jgi:hypothetical protein
MERRLNRLDGMAPGGAMAATWVVPFRSHCADAGVAQMKAPFGIPLATFSLDPGQLVLFPSWVLHDVKPFEGEGTRITIAFNCCFKLSDPA